MTFATATQAELEGVLRLLESSHLPKTGVAEHIGHFSLALEDGVLVGCAGLEIYGDAGLLRSVAVHSGYRSRGLGAKLTESVLDLAEQRGLSSVSLLTETAEAYFQRFGFAKVSRTDLPESLNNSAEFQGACPDSATAMMLVL
jgi:amino-acid N-acetyltransferase